MTAWHKQFKRASKDRRTFEGFVFDSMKEMCVFQDLRIRERIGEIKNLKRQVQHQLILPNGNPILTPKGRVAHYTSDAEWDEVSTGQHMIVDVKGYVDPHSAFRISVFEAISGKKVTILMDAKSGKIKK